MTTQKQKIMIVIGLSTLIMLAAIVFFVGLVSPNGSGSETGNGTSVIWIALLPIFASIRVAKQQNRKKKEETKRKRNAAYDDTVVDDDEIARHNTRE